MTRKLAPPETREQRQARWDSETLGPVRIDPNGNALHAKLVRDALRATAETCDLASRDALLFVADHCNDRSLCYLRRMLK